MNHACSLRDVAVALAIALTLGPLAHAAPTTLNIAVAPAESPVVRARVVFELGPEQPRFGPLSIGSGWVDIVIDGAGEGAVRRCARLVEMELHHVYAPNLHARVTRACDAAALPLANPPAADNSLLRIEEPLDTADILSVSGEHTTGRIVRYTRSGSAVECERDRAKLEGKVKVEDDDPEDHLIADTEHKHADESHDNCSSAAQRDEHVREHEKRRKSPRARWLERDLARERCEDGRRLAGPLAKRHGPDAATLTRSCVRE
jgi:hypothetical protein